MDESPVAQAEASFLSATEAEKKRRSVNYERKRREYGLELLKKRQKVTTILGNERFRAELEEILKGQLESGDNHSRKPRQFHDISERGLDRGSVVNKLPPRRKSSYSRVAMGSNVIPINDLRGVDASKYTVAEKQLRCKLASLYRLLDWHGWVQSIYNHITVKVCKEKEVFLVNAFGLLYSEITASNLVKVDLAGNVLDPGTTQLSFNQAGYVLHSAIHEGRPDVQCVIHVHTAAGVAVSTMMCGLLPISQEAFTIGGISYHDYEGIFVDQQEKAKIIESLGPTNMVMILRNHGLVTLGSTVEEAFDYLYNLVLACEAQVHALSCGLANLIQVSEQVCKQVYGVVRKGGGGVSNNGREWGVGDLEFEAFMRMLDNLGYNTGYPYKAMDLLLPAEEPGRKQILPGRKSCQSEKIGTTKTKVQSSNKSSSESQSTSSNDQSVGVVAAQQVMEQEFQSTSVSGKRLDTVEEQHEPATVTVNPPSAVVDDAWQFLSDSPQEVIADAADQQVQSNASDGLWSFLDEDSVSPDMPARVANSSGTGSRRSSDNETELSQNLISDVQGASGADVELTAQRVANSTSEAVRALANRNEGSSKLKVSVRTNAAISQDAQTFAINKASPEVVQEVVSTNDLAGLQRVIATAERVAASTSGAVLKLGTSFQQQ